MAGLIPYSRRNNSQLGTGYGNFYDIMDDFFSDRWLTGRGTERGAFRLDVRETEKEYVVEAELPGVKKEEVDISLEDKRLSISVNRDENVNEENNGYIHRERRLSSMSRGIYLAQARPEDIKAKLENGMLTITIAKQEPESASHKIAVE